MGLFKGQRGLELNTRQHRLLGEGEIEGLTTSIDPSPIYTGSGINDLVTGGTFVPAACQCDESCYRAIPTNAYVTPGAFIHNPAGFNGFIPRTIPPGYSGVVIPEGNVEVTEPLPVGPGLETTISQRPVRTRRMKKK